MSWHVRKTQFHPFLLCLPPSRNWVHRAQPEPRKFYSNNKKNDQDTPAMSSLLLDGRPPLLEIRKGMLLFIPWQVLMIMKLAWWRPESDQQESMELRGEFEWSSFLLKVRERMVLHLIAWLEVGFDYIRGDSDYVDGNWFPRHSNARGSRCLQETAQGYCLTDAAIHWESEKTFQTQVQNHTPTQMLSCCSYCLLLWKSQHEQIHGTMVPYDSLSEQGKLKEMMPNEIYLTKHIYLEVEWREDNSGRGDNEIVSKIHHEKEQASREVRDPLLREGNHQATRRHAR